VEQVCARCAPAISLAGRAAVLFNYALRPARFIGHCNVRSSLHFASEVQDVQKNAYASVMAARAI
jgi:hypothetical protein